MEQEATDLFSLALFHKPVVHNDVDVLDGFVSDQVVRLRNKWVIECHFLILFFRLR